MKGAQMYRPLGEVWHQLCPGCQQKLAAQSTALVRTRADDGEVVLTFPTVGTGGSEWRLRRAQVEEWQELFPNLDVLGECRQALAWIKAHPDRRKTTRGMPKFLTGWLTRSVDRRGGHVNGNGSALGDKSKLTQALEKASQW